MSAARFSSVACVVAIFAAGCSKDSENTSSTGSSSSSSSSSSSTGATTGGGPTPIRRVFVRNPWGGPVGNLLADGDFELSIDPGTGQYGWVGFNMSASMQIPLVSETGGICRSGLRCARVPKGESLLGRGTAAPNMTPHHASVFAKPATPPADGVNPPSICKGVLSASMIVCDEGVIVRTLKASSVPADDGYCEYAGDVPGSSLSLCMYIQVTEDALIDNATLLPAPAVGTKIEPFALDSDPAGGSGALSGEVDPERAKAAARFVRTHTRFGARTTDAAPPSGVREDLR